MQKHLLNVLALLAIIWGLTACTPSPQEQDHERVVNDLLDARDSVQANALLDSLKNIPPGQIPERAELKSSPPFDPPRN